MRTLIAATFLALGPLLIAGTSVNYADPGPEGSAQSGRGVPRWSAPSNDRSRSSNDRSRSSDDRSRSSDDRSRSSDDRSREKDGRGRQDDDRAGFNGRIKVHEGDREVEPVAANVPQIGCDGLHVHGFGFDDNATGTWSIVTWPPTGERGTTAASGSWSANAGSWRTEVLRLADGHYKVIADQTGAPGNAKHKVFWVRCISAASPAPTPVSSASSSGPGASASPSASPASAATAPAPSAEADVLVAGIVAGAVIGVTQTASSGEAAVAGAPGQLPASEERAAAGSPGEGMTFPYPVEPWPREQTGSSRPQEPVTAERSAQITTLPSTSTDGRIESRVRPPR